MLAALSKVSLVCFAASYTVAFALEIARTLLGWKLRPLWIWLWTSAGLIAHSSYLVMQAREGWAVRGAPLSNWYHWCLIAAWSLAVVSLFLSVSRPKSAVGVFVLPLVLGLLFIARLFPKDQVFQTDRAVQVWGMIHGIGLLMGTVCVLVGFSMGMMYLIQSRRLKKKTPLAGRIQLPSLEWLGQANERLLSWSSILLGGGLLAGVNLNLIRGVKHPSIAWNEGTVIVSAVMLTWLAGVTLFSVVYKPARMGRKVAYLAVANFVILALTLAMALSSRHASRPASEAMSYHPAPDAVSDAVSDALAGRTW